MPFCFIARDSANDLQSRLAAAEITLGVCREALLQKWGMC